VFACLIVPAQGIAAAVLAGLWRGRSGSWLLARAISPWAAAIGAWLGALAAGAALVLLAALSAELAATRGTGSAPVPMRVRERPTLAPGALVAGDAPIERTVAIRARALAPGSVLRLELSSGVGAPSARARVALARRGRPESRLEREVFVFGRLPIDLPLPEGASGERQLADGTGELALEIEHLSGAPIHLRAGAAELLEPCGSRLEISLGIALRLLLLLAVVDALALGLSTWMRPGIAGALALAALVPAWLDERALAVVPGTAAFEALALAGDGLAAPPLGVLETARALAFVAAGLVLAATGQREEAP
jgi:hypothetical protein